MPFQVLLLTIVVLLQSCGQRSPETLSLRTEQVGLPDVIQKPMLTLLGHEKDWYVGIDDRLQFAVDVFEQQSGQDVDIPVVVRPIREKYGRNLAGVCIQVTKVNYSAVVIDEEWYQNHKDTELLIEHAVLHELGHCKLGLGHDNEIMWHDGVGIPTSIMNSYTWTEELVSYYEEFRGVYLDDLFH